MAQAPDKLIQVVIAEPEETAAPVRSFVFLLCSFFRSHKMRF